MSNTTQSPADAREPTDTQINVWSIIRSALSRAWAVADRPQVTSEVVARLDAIAADCEREVLTALRLGAQGEDRWEDLVFGPITEAYNEAHAARRGEGGGK